MAETRACFCIVCLPVVLPVATRAEKIWANLILLGYRLQWAHRPSRDDDGAIEACSGVGRRGRGPEHVAARHAGLGRSLIQVLAFRPAHGLVAAQATPGGAMEVPWRCHGGAVEVPWRCRGGAMEVPWRCHGGAAVETDARSMSYRSFRLPPHRNIRSHPSPSSSLCISHRRCAAEAGTRRDGDRSRVERRSSRREKNWWSARPRRGPGVAEIERFRPGIDRSAI